jgi:uncharacterized protein (TIGR03083 family)
MALGREQAINGLMTEYEDFAVFVRTLDDAQWNAASRCSGWTVGDIARHVVGTATDVAGGVVGTHTPEEEAAMRAGRTQAEIADELEEALGTLRNLGAVIDDNAWDGPSPVPELTMRQGILALAYDVYVHTDDIRAAAGLPPRHGGFGLDASVEYLADELDKRSWGPASLALDGVEKVDVGGGGDTVTGDAMQFVLAATGRGDPAAVGLDNSVNIYADA